MKINILEALAVFFAFMPVLYASEPAVCAPSDPKEIQVYTNIPRGTLFPEHDMVIDDDRKTISFDLEEKKRILHVGIRNLNPETPVTIRFYMGVVSNTTVKWISEDGLWITLNQGKLWNKIPYVALGKGWYQAVVKNEPDFRIATTLPYSLEASLVESVAGNPLIQVRMLGRPPRTFPVFDIGGDDGKKPIHYIIAGEDIWESPNYYVADAMIRYLNGNPDVLSEIARHHLLRIVPALSPYSIQNTRWNYLDEQGNSIYGTARWGHVSPPGEIKYVGSSTVLVE